MKTLSLIAAAALSVIAACDEDPSQPPLGSVSITASAPTLAAGFMTADGWSVKYTKLLVSMTSITVAGSDGVVTASNENNVVNLASTAPISLLSADNRIARAWQDVSFEIGPATADSVPDAPVAQADVDPLVQDGISVYAEATMTKDNVTKTLQLGFTTDTNYTLCGSGVVIPRNGTATADVTFGGEALFADAVVGAHALRGDPIANADGNNDGIVTVAEMNAVSILTARASGPYTTGGPAADTLGAFVTLEVPAIVLSFGGGTCTAAAATADAGAQ